MIHDNYLEIRIADPNHNHQTMTNYQKIILIGPIKFKHKNYNIFIYVTSERQFMYIGPRGSNLC
jgi:hypothetical protein